MKKKSISAKDKGVILCVERAVGIERRDAKEVDRKTREWMHERTNHKYVTGTVDGER